MKNIQVLQKQVVQNITPKRKYIKKFVDIPAETKPEIIVSPEIITVIENENENNVQNKRENNLKKAREARQEKLNNKQSNKEEKINELVETINNEQIEKIKMKSEKLKIKLLKLI
jgi:tRNA G37 N-methylase TrmD